jgi:diamine N-acetyltransferase
VKLQACRTEAELQIIQELAAQIWRAHYPGIITHDQIDYMLYKNYSVASLQKQQGEGQQFFLLLNQEKNIGFIGVTATEDGEGFIHKFYILTELHGRGMGRAAFSGLLHEFPNVHTYRLQVNRRNIKAINFYFSVGFRIETCGDFDIGNGYEMNDFIMVYSRNA